MHVYEREPGKCPKCDSEGCGSVLRTVTTNHVSDGYKNADGVFITNPREWTETQTVVESESLTCLRRQLAAANAKISEMARLAEDSRSEAMVLSDALAKANDALRYYANPLVWKESYDGVYDCSWASIELDKGNIARAALAQPPEEADDE